MAKFLMKQGVHSEAGAVHTVPRDGAPIVIDSEYALDELFGVERFEPVGGDFKAPVAAAAPEGEEQQQPRGRARGMADVSEDVTADHPEAAKEGLKVFRRDGVLVVTTGDAPETPLTPVGKNLATASAVKKFVHDYAAAKKKADKE